jgi:host factor-I protein
MPIASKRGDVQQVALELGPSKGEVCAFRARATNRACKMTGMPFNASVQGAARRGGKTPPPDETFEEAAYLKLLGEKQKPVSIKLADGEVVRGWIEYYDRNMVRLTREGAPNLFIFKHDIMYIAEDSGKRK